MMAISNSILRLYVKKNQGESRDISAKEGKSRVESEAKSPQQDKNLFS